MSWGAVAGAVVSTVVGSVVGGDSGGQQRQAGASAESSGKYYDALADISEGQYETWKTEGLPLLRGLAGARIDSTDRTAEVVGQAANDVKTQHALARRSGQRAMEFARNPGDPGYADILQDSFGREAADVAGAMTNARRAERDRLQAIDDANWARQVQATNLYAGLPGQAITGFNAAAGGQNRNAALYGTMAGASDSRAAQAAYGLSGLTRKIGGGWGTAIDPANPGGMGGGSTYDQYGNDSFMAPDYDYGIDNGYAEGGAIRRRYAEGGAISGPGTGTSDSVKAIKKEGTYILSADTVRALGHKKLTDLMEKAGVRPGMGEKDDNFGVPVRTSNGEWSMPPEVTKYHGEEFFNKLQQKYHRPVFSEDGGAANGGAIRRRSLPKEVEDAIFMSMPRRAIGRRG